VKSDALLEGVNKFVPSLSVFSDRFWLNWVQKFSTYCSLVDVSFIKFDVVQGIIHVKANLRSCHIFYIFAQFGQNLVCM
jgi:hypothetical protein